MNKVRRKELGIILSKLEILKIEIESIKEIEEEVYDNMPESFREGEKGDEVQEGIDSLDEAINSIDESIESIQNVVNH